MKGVLDTAKTLVSQEKIRYVDNEFNLDLTYVTPNIIAMGFPSTGVEAVYRNPRKEVVQFLRKRHDGHYKVYNLCVESDRNYDAAMFDGSAAKYPWYDHSVPPLGMLTYFCRDVDEFLKSDPENVVVIHCKAGKGRTGLAICSYLLWSKKCKTWEESVQFFGEARTSDGKGVTISSQKRFIAYFHQIANPKLFRSLPSEPIMEYDSSSDSSNKSSISSAEDVHDLEQQVYLWKKKKQWKAKYKKEPKQVINAFWNDKNRMDENITSEGKLPPQCPVLVESIIIHNVPPRGSGFVPVIRIQNGSQIWDSRDWLRPIEDNGVPFDGLKTMHIQVPSIRIVDETYITVMLKRKSKSKKLIAALWIHTGFLDNSVHYPRNNLDKVPKNKRKYPDDFAIEMHFKRQSTKVRCSLTNES